jgi:hypothetical protein
MWEIVTGARIPYTALSNAETITFVEQGNRLEKPKGCNDELYSVMMECWNEDPVKRPSFEQLLPKLEKFNTTYKEATMKRVPQPIALDPVENGRESNYRGFYSN